MLILGSGPNRIGQGIEFDYSCVHAATTLSQAGFETVMVNCNPETVSTDYDTADRLYFEPLTFEDVLEVYHAESAVRRGRSRCRRRHRAARRSDAAGPGAAARRRGRADRRAPARRPSTWPRTAARSARCSNTAGLPAPRFGTATSFEQARRIAADIGYPVLVRPSYVLGGRGMEIVYDEETLQGYITRATELSPEHPVLVDRFLEDAIEIDVDALCDGTEVYIGGVMEHIEEAGIHSGDSACALPPVTLGRSDIEAVRRATEAIAHGIGVVGLLNVQYALKDDVLYVLEANPRASRTVPFVSKATAVPLAKACARIMLGATIAQLRDEGVLAATGDGATTARNAPVAVKEAVLPFHRFRKADGSQVDSLLGPEMKSTGEVMGIDRDFGTAFAKSQTAAYGSLPAEGTVFVSVANRDKRSLVFPVKRLADLGFRVLATEGTAEMLRRNGIPCDEVRKHFEAPGAGRPAAVGGRRDPGRRGRHGDQHPVRQLRAAHRRLRDPLGRRGDEHPLRDDGAGRLGGGAGHRGGHPRRHRRDVAAGTAQRAGGRLAMRTGFGSRLADAVVAARARCAWASTRIPNCCAAWGLPADADGLSAFCDDLRRGVRRASRWSSRRSRSSRPTASAGYAVLERTIAALRERGGAGAGRRQARRHRLDDGGLRRGLGRRIAAGRRRGHRLAVSRVRVAAAAAGHRRAHTVAGCSCWPPRPTRRAPPCSAPHAGGRTVAQSIVDAAAAVNRDASPEPGSVGVVVGATLPDAPDVSALGGPVLVPGVGAQGGRPEALAGLGGAAAGPTAARGVARGAAGRTRRGSVAVRPRSGCATAVAYLA